MQERTRQARREQEEAQEAWQAKQAREAEQQAKAQARLDKGAESEGKDFDISAFFQEEVSGKKKKTQEDFR